MQLITIFISVSIFFHQIILIETQNIDIVQTAINNGNFKVLVRALGAADLVDTLRGNGPFTVFAPTDAAFAKLAAGTVDDLLKPANKGKLARILKYHVINGNRLTSAQILALGLPNKVAMLEGDTVNVSLDGNILKVNDGKVIMVNVMANNGIIHVIDTVLMPPAISSATYISLNQSFLSILVFTILFSYLCFE